MNHVPSEVVDALLAASIQAQRAGDDEPLSASTIADAAAAYRQLGPASESRHHLLSWLAADGSAAALAQFAQLMADDPPRDARRADLAFVPLFQGPAPGTAAMFPRLLDGMAHPSIAAVVLDTANQAFRQRGLRPHPAADRWD